ncbi:UNVERIFIED_CONTAM: hypothetical protein HDU68_002618, partial [Siphonaria sp. JEL0065]
MMLAEKRSKNSSTLYTSVKRLIYGIPVPGHAVYLWDGASRVPVLDDLNNLPEPDFWLRGLVSDVWGRCNWAYAEGDNGETDEWSDRKDLL